MENEIKKLIEKYKKESVDPVFRNDYFDIDMVIEDLQSLLEFKKKICCGKAGNG